MEKLWAKSDSHGSLPCLRGATRCFMVERDGW